jgi:thiamine pyrophosphate-dependent acetolactate synthase large subunit-like protein
MKGSSAIAHILKKEGVDHLFCFPVNPLIDAAAELGIRPIMPCTERTVVGMADGYTRVNNGKRIGVCAVQQGPGVENTFGGVAQAFSDSSPVLVFPGGPPQSRQASLPTFDPLPSFQHVAKWVARINQPPRIPEFLRRAFTYLRMGRPGPVVLELPQDVALADLEDPTQSYQGVQASRALADPQNIKTALKAILAAKNPLLHAGLGVLYSEAWGELKEFAEFLQIPVMTTLPGKSCFPENHPLSLGCGGLSGSKVVAQFLSECDLIFAIGSSMSISFFAAPIPQGKTAIQLTIDERDLNKDYPVQIPLMGDVKLTLREMIEEVKRMAGKEGRKGDEAVARKIKAAREGWLNEWMPLLTSDEVPVNPYRVIWDAQKALDLSSTIATHDAGNPRDQTAPFWLAEKPNSYIGWGKSTHLGYSLPLALGAKVAMPQKTVVHIMGDAAFGMSGMEIAAAARNKIATLTILLNNSCLGGYEKHIPIATKLYGTRFLGGDYCKTAEGLGAYSERIDHPKDIIAAVRRAVEKTKTGKPVVLEVITKEENRLAKYW